MSTTERTYELSRDELQGVDFVVMSALFDAMEERPRSPKRIRRRLEVARSVEAKFFPGRLEMAVFAEADRFLAASGVEVEG